MKKIVFIGDSITENGRFDDPLGLGVGYVRVIHDYLTITYPDKDFEIVNKGISGNRITDLKERWEQDVLAEKPDLLSISIGVNDVWRQLDRKEIPQVYPDQYEEIYLELLTKTTEQLDVPIVLMEPTVIEENPEAEGNQLLKPYLNIVRKMAEKFSAILVPTHQAMIDYRLNGGNYDLTTDGVHMNSAGDLLMAKTWINHVAPKVWEK